MNATPAVAVNTTSSNTTSADEPRIKTLIRERLRPQVRNRNSRLQPWSFVRDEARIQARRCTKVDSEPSLFLPPALTCRGLHVNLSSPAGPVSMFAATPSAHFASGRPANVEPE